jgi:uncharacterized protein
MKYALVTGASTGIGKETAIALSNNGFEIGLVGRNQKKLSVTKKIIEKQQGKAIIHLADFSDTNSVISLCNSIIASNIRIDLIANIAGLWHGTNQVYAGINFEKFDNKILMDTMNIGIITPMLLIKNLLPLLNPNALVVNLSGTFENGGKGWLPYFVSKRALEDFTIGLADELKEKNIRVIGISPSDTATESYQQFFFQYINDSIDPKEIAIYISKLYAHPQETGKIFVIKKGQTIFESFHS